MADQAQNNPTFEGHKRMFTEFLEEVLLHTPFLYMFLLSRPSSCLQAEDGKYVEKLKQTISDGRFRLVVGLNDLRQKDRDFTAQYVHAYR